MSDKIERRFLGSPKRAALIVGSCLLFVFAVRTFVISHSNEKPVRFASVGPHNVTPVNTHIISARHDHEPVNKSAPAPTYSPAQKEAQAALISAISDSDSQVSEHALYAIHRINMFQPQPLKPELISVLEKLLTDDSSSLQKRFFAAQVLMSSEKHADVVMKTFLECMTSDDDSLRQVSISQMYLYCHVAPTAVLAHSCDLPQSHQLLKTFYNQLRELAWSQFEKSIFDITYYPGILIDLNEMPGRLPNAEGDQFDMTKINFPPSVIPPVAPQISKAARLDTPTVYIALVLLGTCPKASEIFLDEFKDDIAKPRNIKIYTDPEEERTSWSLPSLATPDQFGKVLEIVQPESDSVMNVYLKETKAEQPLVRRVATTVLGNILFNQIQTNNQQGFDPYTKRTENRRKKRKRITSDQTSDTETAEASSRADSRFQRPDGMSDDAWKRQVGFLNVRRLVPDRFKKVVEPVPSEHSHGGGGGFF